MRQKRIWTAALMLALALALLPPARPAQAATYTVNSTNDVNDGTCNATHCSLREAINAANSNPGADIINFNILCGGGVCVITLVTPLPALTDDNTTIDGYTQPGAAQATEAAPATILIEINGNGIANSGFNVLSADNVIRGLAINRFGQNGIAIGPSTATSNRIAGNYIGLNAGGTIDRGNGFDGVFVGAGATGNIIGGSQTENRNVISGNEWDGVGLHGAQTTGNFVLNNYIGTDHTGTLPRGNTLDGVRIYGGAHDNMVGADLAGFNVIGGNGRDGVHINDAGSDNNVVVINHIGIAADASTGLGNAQSGVHIGAGAQGNAVESNCISDNAGAGVEITGADTANNRFWGNLIGVGADASGIIAVPNGEYGVAILNGAHNNAIGGSYHGNLISGNEWDGVYLFGVSGNTVAGNRIGIGWYSATALGNDHNGIYVGGDAHDNVIGGDTEDERNVISGNRYSGIVLEGPGVSGNTVSGNRIGTDGTGTAAVPNGDHGIAIQDGAQANTIGGTSGVTPGGGCTGDCNLISGNAHVGVLISDTGTLNNTVMGNLIGVDASGALPLANWYGVAIADGAQGNTIGGDEAAERNIISGNGQVGVGLQGSGTADNIVSGNYIGLDTSGTAALGNLVHGVVIQDGASENTIGGSNPGQRNVISGNGNYGVGIWGANTYKNSLIGNYIGTNAAGTGDGGPGFFGVYITNGAYNTWIEGGIIAHHTTDGIALYGSTTIQNTISQVRIYDNGGLGINLVDGANEYFAAPVISATIAGSVNIVGTACAGCTVEVFANDDTDGEGETYIGSSTAAAGDVFTVTVSSLSKPYLTATSTVDGKGTSEFSAVFTATVPLAPGSGAVYLPIILKSY